MSFSDVLSLRATEEVKWLHGCKSSSLSPEGYVVIGRKTPGYCPKRKDHVEDSWQQKAYKLSSIESILDTLIPAKGVSPGDTYISQATFSIPGRRATGFSRVQSAWVDLDYYDDSYGAPQWSVIKLQKIKQHIQDLGLPEPSLIVDSGRGAYVKWIFQAPTHDLPLWNNLQKALTVLFAQLNADFQAKDASRVLRCLQTVNRKNSAVVSVIAGSGKEYDFKTFATLVAGIYGDEVAPHLIGGASAAKRRHARAGKKIADALERAAQGDMAALSIYKEMRQPVMLESLTECSLNWARFSDLRDVVLMRGGFEVGQRNNMLLWMVNCLSHAKVITTKNWELEINDLLKAFPVGDDFDPIETGSLSTLKDRLTFEEHARSEGKQVYRANGLYRPRNEFLIDSLHITEQEQKNLKTLISRGVKNERRRIKRDASASGRSQRRADRDAWHERVLDLIREKFAQKEAAGALDPEGMSAAALGINVSLLANDLGIDRTIVSKFLKQKIPSIFSAKLKRNLDGNEVSHKSCLKKITSEAVASIQNTQQKHKSIIEKTAKKDREIGQKRLGAAVAKIRQRSLGGASSGVEVGPASVMPEGYEMPSNDLNWAVQKVEAMTSPSNSNQSRPVNMSAAAASTKPPIAVFRAGMFAQRPPEAKRQIPPVLRVSPAVDVAKTTSHTQTTSTKTTTREGEKGVAPQVAVANTQFFVGARKRPRLFPSACTWGSLGLPLNTRLSSDEWEHARASGRYFVVELVGDHTDGFGGLVRVINPEHPGSASLVAGQDLYGMVLDAPDDPRSLGVVKSLDGCTLLASRGRARAPEAVEDKACLFFGQTYFVSRPPIDYSEGEKSHSHREFAHPTSRPGVPNAVHPGGLKLPRMPEMASPDGALAPQDSTDADNALDDLYASEGLEPAP